jgi:serine protease Do
MPAVGANSKMFAGIPLKSSPNNKPTPPRKRPIQNWQLRMVRHPTAGVPLWVPFGVGFNQIPTRSGINFENANKTRYQAIRLGIIGFTLSWTQDDTQNAVLHGERLATLMSDLFRANIELGLPRSPPISRTAPVAVVPQSHAFPTGDPSGARGQETGQPKIVWYRIFCVVEDCNFVQVTLGLAPKMTGRIMTQDFANGLRDDTRFLQISAPVQPGNSGGPLLDYSGNVVGVVVGKLNAITVGNVTNDLPQNVNFAIKANVVTNFLDVNSVAYTSGSLGSPTLQPSEIAERAKSFAMNDRVRQMMSSTR